MDCSTFVNVKGIYQIEQKSGIRAGNPPENRTPEGLLNRSHIFTKALYIFFPLAQYTYSTCITINPV